MSNTNKETAVKKEVPMSPMKSFKSSADLENCYRFIHENDLRREALMIFKHILDKCPTVKTKGKSRSKKNLQ
jgi:hypothetical protein